LRQSAGLAPGDRRRSSVARSKLVQEAVASKLTPGEHRTADPQATGSYPAAPPALAPPVPDAPTQPAAALSTERSSRDPAFFRTIANLGMQAASGLEHAHQLG